MFAVVVTFPVTVNVPVVTVIISFLPAEVAVIVIEAHCNEPALIFTLHKAPVEGRGIVRAPIKTNEFVLLIVNALVVVTGAKVIDPQVAEATSTVKVKPALIVIASAVVGCPPAPDPVEIALQFVLAPMVIAAP